MINVPEAIVSAYHFISLPRYEHRVTFISYDDGNQNYRRYAILIASLYPVYLGLYN